MRILTVRQPFASLIALPDDDPRAKRVENRGSQTKHRGPLLIHAGKSLGRIRPSPDGARDERYGLEVAAMPFGAVVAAVELIDCVYVSYFNGDTSRRPSVNVGVRERHPWLYDHPHLEGPYAWVLAKVRRLAEPVPCRGMLGLRGAPAAVVAEVLRQLPDLAEALA